MYLSSAPLQGYTDAVYRRIHRKYFSGIDNYYSPFLRIEKGDLRAKDLRDISPENNNELTIPQLLPANQNELARMIDAVQEMGWGACDLNFACPFPMLSKRGKGAGMLANLDVLEEITQYLSVIKDMKVSVKMRLGYDKIEQGFAALDILKDLNLVHITCHARLGTDKYTSPLRLDDFEAFYKHCKHPLLYNGNVESLENAKFLVARFPKLKGFALGRSLLQRPQLAQEIKKGKSQKLATEILKDFHNELLAAYSQSLQGGDHQVLFKLKTVWDYLLATNFPREIKKIKKCTSWKKYENEVNNLFLIYNDTENSV